MEPNSKPPLSRRQRALAPFLLAWIALVALAGWTPEIRPDFLDPAYRKAVAALRLLGISAGQPLFHTGAGRWKTRGHCLLIRASPPPADGELLFPPAGACRFDGIHWRLPPMSRATHRMLSSAFKNYEREEVRTRVSDGYMAAIGRHFCTRTEPRAAEIEAVWTWYYIDYYTSETTHQNGAQFRYACESAQLADVAWLPPDDAVLRFWGSPPWQ